MSDIVDKYYRGNLYWLPFETIYVCEHGSRAYGTDGPDSDLDLRGVFIAPRRYFLGFMETINQVDKGFEGADACLYNLPRFMSLAVDNNPNMLELLWVDESNYKHTSPAWETIVDHRDLFLSQNVKHRFCGYAISQLKRIESHRRWLLHPPDHKPTRTEFGLPDYNAIPKEQREALEAMMLKIVEGWQVDLAVLDTGVRIDLMNKLAQSLTDMKLSADDQYVAAGNKLGLDSQAMEYLKAERAYRARLSEWNQYQTWLKERNPIRAALEANHGYDTKHGLHLVRLMRMAREMLDGRGVIVKRPDAEELKAIRAGAWSYEKLMEWASQQDTELSALLRTTTLPRNPDRAMLDVICQRLVKNHSSGIGA